MLRQVVVRGLRQPPLLVQWVLAASTDAAAGGSCCGGGCGSSSSSNSSTTTSTTTSSQEQPPPPPEVSPAEEALYTQGQPPTPLLADLQVAGLGPDRGRGVVARHSLAAGQLLMAVQPAAILHGPFEAPPEPDLLVPALVAAAARDARVAAAVTHLFDGSRQSSTADPPSLPALAMQPSSSPPQDEGGCHDHSHSPDHHQSTTAHHAAAADSSPGREAAVLSLERAERLVRFNAFSDGYEDLAAAHVRRQRQHQQRGTSPAADDGLDAASSFTGLFPAFALLNHSCAPAAVHYVVGDTLVVRAVEPVAAGHEVTVSYLGREDFAPASSRQAILQERFGFSCACERCRLEQAAPPALQQLLADTFATVQHALKPAFMLALEAGHGCGDVHEELAALEARLSTAFSDARMASPAAVLALQASVYDLYELLLFCEQMGAGAAAGGSPAEQAHAVLGRLGRCLAIASCVAKGSELSVLLASRLLAHALDARGAGSSAAEAAAALLQDTHLLRYGAALPPALTLELMQANKVVAEQLLL